MDMYVLATDRERVVELTKQIGLKDVYDQYPYDRNWTYRASDGNVIVETIWTMRNHRAVANVPPSANGIRRAMASVDRPLTRRNQIDPSYPTSGCLHPSS
jgi:hypothetical protein